MKNKDIKKIAYELVYNLAFKLPEDVLTLLIAAHRREKNRKAKKVLKWILDNAKIASKENIAICQDTGMPILFIFVGKKTRISYSFVKILEKEIEEAYQYFSLRASIVNPLERKYPSYRGIVSHIEFVPHYEKTNITLLAKGFGSENKSQLKMFNPTVDREAIDDFIIESVKKAGPEACPPFFIGIGIGATAENALLLSKKALLEDLREKNRLRILSLWEEKLKKKINKLMIGPMGLGGKNTCLAVRINISPTHIAGLPVGVSINCHALRKATVVI